MKYPESAECRRLAALLEDALARERRLWKAPVFKNHRIQGTDISSFQHQDAILWMDELSQLFKFCPETFALGVSIFNRLLASVKAQQKYLRCIAITSLILAEKINEEDEVIASVKDFVNQSGCNFSTAEIVRMERIILDKLHWDLNTATAIDFIHIFHALVTSGQPRLPQRRHQREPFFHTALWIRQVQHCMACHQLSQFKGSTLALAIITLELERAAPDWFSVFTDLLKKAQVESVELIRCKETADELLSGQELTFPPNALYIFDGGSVARGHPELAPGGAWGRVSHAGRRRRSQAQRKEKDAAEYYDGFGCLYDQGVVPADIGGDPPGSYTPCPPLQPPVS
uniref:Cyclin I family member 2 n=1 Tax=Paramormyrops kingsleyae TaxID=1676925 RepID=A0A3B3QQ08_9TELE